MTARISVLTNTGRYVGLHVLDCANCGVVFALHDDYSARLGRRIVEAMAPALADLARRLR